MVLDWTRIYHDSDLSGVTQMQWSLKTNFNKAAKKKYCGYWHLHYRACVNEQTVQTPTVSLISFLNQFIPLLTFLLCNPVQRPAWLKDLKSWNVSLCCDYGDVWSNICCKIMPSGAMDSSLGLNTEFIVHVISGCDGYSDWTIWPRGLCQRYQYSR